MCTRVRPSVRLRSPLLVRLEDARATETAEARSGRSFRAIDVSIHSLRNGRAGGQAGRVSRVKAHLDGVRVRSAALAEDALELCVRRESRRRARRGYSEPKAERRRDASASEYIAYSIRFDFIPHEHWLMVQSVKGEIRIELDELPLPLMASFD